MYVKLKQNGRELTAVLYGEIDHHTASKMREEIDTAIEQKKPTVLKLDFSGIKFMDSSGIGLIMGRYKLMTMMGGKLEIVNVPDSLKRVIKLSGVTTLGIMKE